MATKADYYADGARSKRLGLCADNGMKQSCWAYKAWKQGYDETPVPATSEWAGKAPAQVVADLKAVNPEPSKPVLLIPAVAGEIPLATSCLAALPTAVASHLRCLVKQHAELSRKNITRLPVKEQQSTLKTTVRLVKSFKRIWKRHNTIPVEVSGKYLFSMLSDPGHSMFKHLHLK